MMDGILKRYPEMVREEVVKKAEVIQAALNSDVEIERIAQDFF